MQILASDVIFHPASQSFVLWRIISMHCRQISLTQQFSSFCKVLFTSLTQSNFSCTKRYLWWNLRTWVECGIKFVQLQLDTHFLFNNEPLNQLHKFDHWTKQCLYTQQSNLRMRQLKWQIGMCMPANCNHRTYRHIYINARK